MKFVVIGLGSMGKRRIRLLLEYINKTDNARAWEICGIDSRKDRCSEAELTFSIITAESLETAIESFKPDAALVCTSPVCHADIIKKCLEANLHVFTEINIIADGYENNIKLSEQNDRILYLSSTPMHRREMQYIKNWASEKKYRLSYIYHIGQYLPEWHPWENYKDFFVNDKRTNGCRELFAIELPWMVDAFGDVVNCTSLHSKITDLKLDYDDSYQVIFKHESGMTGCLIIDVATPVAGRRLEIYGENSHLLWEGAPDSLQVIDEERKVHKISLYNDYSHMDGYEKFVVEDAYYEEIKDFISCIEHNRQPKYTFDKDKKIIEIIDRIES